LKIQVSALESNNRLLLFRFGCLEKPFDGQDLVPQTELKEKITEFCKKHGIVMGNESSNVPSPTKKTREGSWGSSLGVVVFIKGNAVINYWVVSTIVFVHPEPWERFPF